MWDDVERIAETLGDDVEALVLIVALAEALARRRREKKSNVA